MKTKISNVRIITSSERGVIENGSILFDQSGILAVTEGDVAVKADVEIDGNGKTVLPGLIDSHVHLGMDCSPDPFRKIAQDSESETAMIAFNQGQVFLKHGITSVRNLGTRYNADIAYRNAISAGIVKGPRIFAAGQPIVMTGGHGHVLAIEANGVNSVRKAARTQLKAGADVLKLMATGGVLTNGTDPGATALSELELQCACHEAKKASKTTAAHAIGTDGIKNAVRAGITTIEHGTMLDDDAVALMKEKETYLVPTLIAAGLILDKGDAVPDYMIRKVQGYVEQHKSSFQKALNAGVKIAAGTDAGTPFNEPGLLADELQLMVDAGMSPLEAIKSATMNAAECVNAQNIIGSLEEGKQADLIMVQGNPLKNVTDLKNIKHVFQAGKEVYSISFEREKLLVNH